MGIFNGIEILFFFLGVFTTTGIFGLIHLRQTLKSNRQVLLLAGVGLFLSLFTTAWSVSSILEKEHQAANMGLLFFGLPSVLLMGMAWKKLQSQVL